MPATSTLNLIITKKRKMGKELTYSKHQAFLWEKSLKISARMGTELFSFKQIFCFKQCHGLVFDKFVRESAAVDTNASDL
jgi:hypothetical protein